MKQHSAFKTQFAPIDTDHQLVKDGYEFIVGDMQMLFSPHFLAGLLTKLRYRAEGKVDHYRNPETVGCALYDSFEFGATRADMWWESLTDHLRAQYCLS